MVFLGSRNLIQSEAVLRRHHPASLKGKISSAGGGATQEPAMEVDHSQLPCGYHTAIVAGLALIGASGALRIVNLSQNSFSIDVFNLKS